jgi:prepilin-type N-terminal cleavage/methylation domain-containing protein
MQAKTEMKAKQGSAGVTLIELIAALAIAGVLTAGAGFTLFKFAARNRVDAEASKVVDALWELRSRATTGMRNPCMDFPAPDSVRLYSDTSSRPDGYGEGDRPIAAFRYRGGVTALSIAGGQGAGHYVCFESRGMMGSAGAALMLTLGIDSTHSKSVRLLPSTGIAKVL